jgi:hypothetical protein
LFKCCERKLFYVSLNLSSKIIFLHHWEKKRGGRRGEGEGSGEGREKRGGEKGGREPFVVPLTLPQDTNTEVFPTPPSYINVNN